MDRLGYPRASFPPPNRKQGPKMNPIARILTIGTIGTLGLSGVALASDPSNTSGAFGIGSSATMGGINGISARYGLGGGLALEGAIGYGSSSVTQTDKKTNGSTSGNLDLGVAFDYKPPVMRGERVAASVTAEVNYLSWKVGTISDGEEKGQKFSDIVAGAGLRVEYWPASWMSVNTKVGLTLSPNGSGQQAGQAYGGDDDGGDDDTDYGGMDIGVNGDVFGGAAVTFWFKN